MDECKLKIGDFVVINKPLDTSEFPVWSKGMDKYDGSVGTIAHLKEVRGVKIAYIVGGGGFTYNVKWVEPCELWLNNDYEWDVNSLI